MTCAKGARERVRVAAANAGDDNVFLHTTTCDAMGTGPRTSPSSPPPQFHENSWGSGNEWRHILRFKSTWIQGTWWKKGGTVGTFHPGEEGTFSGNNYDMIQLSGIVIPDSTRPIELRGTSALGGVNPFYPELFR